MKHSDSPARITPETVVNETSFHSKKLTDQLVRDEAYLHRLGYHAYQGALCDFRCKVEKAFGELVDELFPDEPVGPIHEESPDPGWMNE